ncbi:MAG: 3-hydroxyacyl-ACP dehydratase FabZ family protein [Phycisphaerae bacterium]
MSVDLHAIPHRDPFLLIDEVVESSDDRMVTKRFIDPSLDVFRGHYPDRPVLPGIFICESCFQTGALLIAHRQGSYGTDQGVPVLTRIQDARFKRMVKPGETLHIDVTLDEEMSGAYYFTGRVTVDGDLALRVTFVCMMAEG